MKLTTEDVHELFMSLFFKEDESRDNFVPVLGITLNIGLHPGRVNAARPQIQAMIDELPWDSQNECHFLVMCADKHGHQWTGVHGVMQELVMMGLAIGCIEYTMPRPFWSYMPGEMPYLRRRDHAEK